MLVLFILGHHFIGVARKRENAERGKYRKKVNRGKRRNENYKRGKHRKKKNERGKCRND
jgi:hypothetical protein